MNFEDDVKRAVDTGLAGLEPPNFHPGLVERVRKARIARLGVSAIVVAAVAGATPWVWSTVGEPEGGGAPVVGALTTPLPSPIIGSCETGPWATYCPEAAWARLVAANAGYEVQGDTGSALIIQAPGRSFYFWAFEPEGEDPSSRRSTALVEENYELLMEVEGTPVYFDGIRLTWDAHGMWVWLDGGPKRGATETARGVIAPIVEASLETPYP